MKSPALVKMPEKIEVKAQSYGKLFRLCEGFGKAMNRTLDPKHAKELGALWPIVRQEVIKLLLSEDKSFYYILDGQHRIYYISEILRKSDTLLALIYRSSDELPEADVVTQARGSRIANFISDSNSPGKAFRCNAHLQNYSKSSIWPDIFGEYGLSPTNGRVDSWSCILKSHLLAEACLRLKRVTTGGVQTPALVACWLMADPKEIHFVARNYAIWRTVAERADQVLSSQKRRGHFLSLFGIPATTTFLLAAAENDPKLLADGRLNNFIDSMSLDFASKQASQLDDSIRIFLKIINFKRVTQLVTVLGRTGR